MGKFDEEVPLGGPQCFLPVSLQTPVKHALSFPLKIRETEAQEQ